MSSVIERPIVFQTEKGLTVGDAQIALYPIVHCLKAEWPASLVQMRFELTNTQMRAILAYIEQHPQEVELDYVAGYRRAEENRRAWQGQPTLGQSTEACCFSGCFHAWIR